MKSRKTTYFKYFSLFLAIAVSVFIAGCTGVSPTASIVTVTYNGNGNTAGTVPVDPASPYEYGATVTVLGNTGGLTRINVGGTSYRFTGWNTKADGSGSGQAEGSTFTIGASPVTLYAQWTPYVLLDIGPAGGYIFYDRGSYLKADFAIVKASGNGTVPITPPYDTWRYLEAAPSDQSASAPWGCLGGGQSRVQMALQWVQVSRIPLTLKLGVQHSVQPLIYVQILAWVAIVIGFYRRKMN